MEAILTIIAIGTVLSGAVVGVALYECHRHERERREAEEAAARMDDPSHEFTSK